MTKKEDKKQVVESLISKVQDAEAVIVSDYSGLDVAAITILRKEIAKEGFEAQVIKNTMVNRAFENLKLQYPEALLKGPNIFFRANNDVVKLSKLLVSFGKENEHFELKGGFLNGNYIDQSEIRTLAQLPSQDELLAKAIGLIKAPLTGLVARLSSPINGVIGVLNNIKNNK